MRPGAVALAPPVLLRHRAPPRRREEGDVGGERSTSARTNSVEQPISIVNRCLTMDIGVAGAGGGVVVVWLVAVV